MDKKLQFIEKCHVREISFTDVKDGGGSCTLCYRKTSTKQWTGCLPPSTAHHRQPSARQEGATWPPPPGCLPGPAAATASSPRSCCAGQAPRWAARWRGWTRMSTSRNAQRSPNSTQPSEPPPPNEAGPKFANPLLEEPSSGRPWSMAPMAAEWRRFEPLSYHTPEVHRMLGFFGRLCGGDGWGREHLVWK